MLIRESLQMEPSNVESIYNNYKWDSRRRWNDYWDCYRPYFLSASNQSNLDKRCTIRTNKIWLLKSAYFCFSSVQVDSDSFQFLRSFTPNEILYNKGIWYEPISNVQCASILMFWLDIFQRVHRYSVFLKNLNLSQECIVLLIAAENKHTMDYFSSEITPRGMRII